MELRFLLLILFSGFSLFGNGQSFFDMPFQINVGEVTWPDTNFVRVALKQKSTDKCEIKNIQILCNDADIANWPSEVNAGDSLIFHLRFYPRQNVNYFGTIYINTHESNYVYACQVVGKGKFSNSLYDSTFNLYDEALKGALKVISGKKYISLGYNSARDKLFMEIDNQRTNGGGASQNSLICAYTGRVINGYSNRQDAQTSYNFNTEHTWPQSLFTSSEPMQSDMHHLYPVDEAANSERGNNPLGFVSNPNWTVGGSKSNGGTFEPRDAHKGKAARSLLYFSTRYQNYAGFLTAQEQILKNWALTFLPDSAEHQRNLAIESYQKNRNPYIDYPQFLERILSISLTKNRAVDYSFFIPLDTIDFGVIESGDSVWSEIPVSHMGSYLVPINGGASGKGHVTIRNQAFTQEGIPGFVKMGGRIYGNIGTYFDTLSLESQTSVPLRKLLVIKANIKFQGQNSSDMVTPKSQLTFQMMDGGVVLSGFPCLVEVFSLDGKRQGIYQTPIQIPLPSQGTYIFRWTENQTLQQNRIFIP